MKRQFFKYLSRENAEAMLKRGEIRVSTLSDFRKAELYGAEIGDKGEGTEVAYSRDSLVDFDRPETVSPFVRKFIKSKGTGNRLMNVEFQERRSIEDVFVYCASIDFNPGTLKRLNYEACVLVKDVELFANIVMQILNAIHPIEELLVGPVIYQDRKRHWSETSENPAFVKEPIHQYQNEARVVLVPKALPIEPKILLCPDVIPICKLYNG